MLPPETENTVPENAYPEKHETLSKEETVPSKSIHRRRERDPEFREWMEAHD